jgi:hypothetical protein
MMNNPNSSEDTFIGPLMRHVKKKKKKICQDCELIALLEEIVRLVNVLGEHRRFEVMFKRWNSYIVDLSSSADQS